MGDKASPSPPRGIASVAPSARKLLPSARWRRTFLALFRPGHGASRRVADAVRRRIAGFRGAGRRDAAARGAAPRPRIGTEAAVERATPGIDAPRPSTNRSAHKPARRLADRSFDRWRRRRASEAVASGACGGGGGGGGCSCGVTDSDLSRWVLTDRPTGRSIDADAAEALSRCRAARPRRLRQPSSPPHAALATPPPRREPARAALCAAAPPCRRGARAWIHHLRCRCRRAAAAPPRFPTAPIPKLHGPQTARHARDARTPPYCQQVCLLRHCPLPPPPTPPPQLASRPQALSRPWASTSPKPILPMGSTSPKPISPMGFYLIQAYLAHGLLRRPSLSRSKLSRPRGPCLRAQGLISCVQGLCTQGLVALTLINILALLPPTSTHMWWAALCAAAHGHPHVVGSSLRCRTRAPTCGGQLPVLPTTCDSCVRCSLATPKWAGQLCELLLRAWAQPWHRTRSNAALVPMHVPKILLLLDSAGA
eukprot:360976-Chlamydomonas_euryale.AAC.2